MDPQRQPVRHCKHCDYDLAASPAGACPECGSPFDPGDARTYSAVPKATWRGRIRRWRWALAAMALLVVAWPRGLLFISAAWVDPAGSASIRGRALVIGRPWWLGGWWPTISWSAAGGAVPQPRNNGEVEQFALSVLSTDSPWLFSMRHIGTGRVAVSPIPPVRSIPPADWREMLREFARRLAADSGSGTARSGGGMVISAPTPPWAIEVGSP